MIYAFGDYELDTQRHELHHAGTPCSLEPQVYAVLLYLIRHRDRMVSKQELLDQVWPETFVSESTLYQRLRAVRQAVGDSGRAQRVIKTVHKQGYRFSAVVEERQPTAVGEGILDTSVVELPVVPETPEGAAAMADASLLPVVPAATDRMPGAERKLATVLCGTLANAELLADRLGFESLGRLRQTLFKLAEAEVEPYEGMVQPYSDDGFLVLFGVPDLPKVISDMRRQGWTVESRKRPFAAAIKRVNDYAVLKPPDNLPVREIQLTEYWVSK